MTTSHHNDESVSERVMDNPSHEDRFKRNLSDLFRLLQKLTQDNDKINTSSFAVIGAIINSFESTELISSFIEKSQEHWDLVHRRDVSFIENLCDDIFSDLSMEDHKIFCNILHKITGDDIDMIWGYFDSFIKISIKYIHFIRNPKIKDIGRRNGLEKVYLNGFYPQVEVKKCSEIWKVKLEW